MGLRLCQDAAFKAGLEGIPAIDTRVPNSEQLDDVQRDPSGAVEFNATLPLPQPIEAKVCSGCRIRPAIPRKIRQDGTGWGPRTEGG